MHSLSGCSHEGMETEIDVMLLSFSQTVRSDLIHVALEQHRAK